ncbi:hypothetical protein CQ12_34950 [Bradyrhizobium jicamae]|uniref:Serine acetyltransferase n=1 Tax=Bradyrhizobium jicamae TaxID=280332 RepID=A0A0R3LX77_9BRAD|nr:hypothetical protein CQ12_34950 [Bradyrhizobium jicamae]
MVVGACAKILGPITVGGDARIGAPIQLSSRALPTSPWFASRRARAVAAEPSLLYRPFRPRPSSDVVSGDAIAVLLDRVEFLEARLGHTQRRLREAGLPRDDQPIPGPEQGPPA